MTGTDRLRRWHTHSHGLVDRRHRGRRHRAGGPRDRRHRDRGQSGAEYAAMVGVVSLVVAAIVGLSVPADEATGLKS
ncbi:hypothetical protein ACFW92_22300, partial [Streptomyces scopuliridis]